MKTPSTIAASGPLRWEELPGLWLIAVPHHAPCPSHATFTKPFPLAMSTVSSVLVFSKTAQLCPYASVLQHGPGTGPIRASFLRE